MNKICMYTVCRNESSRIEEWWKSASEADKVAVVVHDCDDDTEEKLRKLGALIKVTHYDTWRFDVGKNDALDWAREIASDCNILVYTALDEIFDPGWAEILRKNWTDNTLQVEYNFVQTHDEYGRDLHQTRFNWIHSNEPNWYWVYPIHEALLYKGNCQGRKTLDFFDKIKLEHWPDKTKTREYPELLEARYKEYKDHLSLLYLMIAYAQAGEWEKGIKLFKEYNPEESTLTPNETAYLINILGDCYTGLHDYEKAITCLKDLIRLRTYQGYRDPYINLAFIHFNLDSPYESLKCIEEAFTNTKRHFDWVENPTYWNNVELELAAAACMSLGEFEESLGFIELYKHFNKATSETNEAEKECLRNILNE